MARKKPEPTDNPWNERYIRSLAPDAASIPAAREVIAKGVFRAVEPTADGRGWWCQCRGLTDTYQVVVRRKGNSFECECNCLSYKNPCKHALALLLHLLDHPELRAAPEQKGAAGDFESLLRAVFANPEDDAVRLVFADFLDESGQADRAALIRHQCELTRLRANSSRHKELTRLVNKLVPKLRKQTGVFPYAQHYSGLQYAFRRGFLHAEGYFDPIDDLDAVPAKFVDLFRDGWVETVRTFVYGPDDFSNGWVPLVAHVAELDMSGHEMSEASLIALAAVAADARRNGRLVRVRVHKRNQKSFDRLAKAAG